MNTDSQNISNKERLYRFVGITAATLITICVILVLNTINIPKDLARCLVDRGDEPNYFAIQNLMWLAFFIGISELIVRYISSKLNRDELKIPFLPTDPESILTISNMPSIHNYAHVNGQQGDYSKLTMLLASQFQISKSVTMCNDMLKSYTELRTREISLKYNIVRYISWLLPSLGFIGTVWGILLSLDTASNMAPTDPQLLPKVIGALGVAFFTTLLSLIMSCILMLIAHVIEAGEENNLNSAGQNCLKYFINRVIEK